MRITHDEWPMETRISRTVKEFLAYLILFRHRIHAREVLAGLFWGDHSDEKARSCLSTALWRLRKILEPDEVPKGAYLLTTPAGDIGFNRESEHWLDIDVFEHHGRQILAKPHQTLTTGEVHQLEIALNLYRGELLEGFYDEWALRERERLRSLYLHSLAHLLQYYRHFESYKKGLACGHKILDLDPLREEIHREMMRLYYRNGQRALALRQYDNCSKILENELGVPPMEETQLLRFQIFNRSDTSQIQNRSQGDLHSAREAIREFQQALKDFDRSTAKLRQTSKTLERLIECEDLA
jgi:DNA-binding SARP family transcriptional activator